MVSPTALGKALRFLLTDRCNLRCTFCHNEFQGDVSQARRSVWSESLVEQLFSDFSLSNTLRVKFSGGEPLLRWVELQSLLQMSKEADARDITLFSNLTLASSTKLYQLAELGLNRINTNLPSFAPDIFSARTGQERMSLERVLSRARIARSLGIHVQFNLVMPAFPEETEASAFLDAELRAASEEADAWDALALIADARGPSPRQAQEWIHESLAGMPDVQYADDRVLRGEEFHWLGKSVFASRCTDWSVASELAEADWYILPPGRILPAHAPGRAYRQ
jgi:pyruvate-formate lyase-activating enzyme